MASKHPKPFFRTARNCWYVQLGKRQVRLQPDEQESLKLYHRLMADGPGRSAALAPQPGLAAIELFDKYLDWCQRHRRPRTYGWYKGHIEDFLASLPNPRLAAADVRPFHVVEWVDRHSTWGPSQRRGAIIAIQRPFNWATKLGYIDSNPVAHVEKPRAPRREAFVSPEEWARIRDHYPDGDPFRDLLEFCWETGCRPQEAKAIEARHLSPDRTTILFPPAEAKGGRRWRRILLGGRATEIVARLLPDRPRSPLLERPRPALDGLLDVQPVRPAQEGTRRQVLRLRPTSRVRHAAAHGRCRPPHRCRTARPRERHHARYCVPAPRPAGRSPAGRPQEGSRR